MARYGESAYAAAFLGDVAPSLFHAENFIAHEVDYGDVTLEWSTPGGDWQVLRLLRNQNGYPADETNGIPIYEASVGTDAGRFIDRGLLTDRWVYYSLFVFNAVNGVWLRSGNARVYVPDDHESGERLYRIIPRRQKPPLYDTSVGIDPATQRVRSVNPLAAFMGLFGYQYDVLLSTLNSALDFYDSSRVCYDLIPTMLRQFHFNPEPEIGPEQYRRLLRNAAFLYQTKGSRAGVHALVASLTGWDSYIRLGTNLMWDAEHSDFVGGIGYWAAGAVNCAAVWKDEDATPSAMRMVAVDDGDVSTSFVTPDNVEHLGIVVLPVVDYNVSATINAGNASHRNARLEIDWYDKDSNLLSTSDGGNVATTDSGVQLEAIAASPADAVRMGVTIRVLGAVADEWWTVSHVQVNRNSARQPTEPGRDVHVVLRSQRKNVVPNGSLGLGLQGWVEGPTDIALTLDATRGAVGSSSARLEYTGPGLASTAVVPVDGLPHASLEFDTTPGLRYVLQVKVAAEVGGPSLIGLTARDDALGAGGPLARAGLTRTMVTQDFTLYAFPFIADANKTSFVAYFREATTGDVVWLDALLAEPQSEGTDSDIINLSAVQPYFDGASGSLTDDYLWEGKPYLSPSHFYSRRTIHEARLRALLPKFLPLGDTFTLFWALPDEEYYALDDVVLVESAPIVPTTPVSKTLTGRWRDDILVSKVVQGVWSIT